MEEKIEKILKIVESTEKKIDNLAERVKKLEEREMELKAEIQTVKEENVTLKLQLENLEQYSRRNNLIISGIPTNQNENIREITKNLAKIWNVEIQNYDIVAAHRLYSRTKIPDIIIKFNNREKVVEMIKKSKSNKINSDKLQLEPATPIFCSEHLTPYTKKILAYTKKLRQEGKIKYVWVKEGSVLIRVEEDMEAQKIKNEFELEKLIESLSPYEQEQHFGNITLNGKEASEQESGDQTPNKKRPLSVRSPMENSNTKFQQMKKKFPRNENNTSTKQIQSTLKAFKTSFKK